MFPLHPALDLSSLGALVVHRMNVGNGLKPLAPSLFSTNEITVFPPACGCVATETGACI